MPPKFNFFLPQEIEGLDLELCAKLDWARGRAGIPLVITRGKSTEEQNKAVGGVKDSAHLRGLGADLACDNGLDRYKMVNALLLAGFKRIGVYSAHCHVDADLSLPQNVIWVGEEHV